MRNKDLDNETYNQLMKLIDTVKMHSGCEEVKLVGDNESFEKLMAIDFPLGEFKCENMGDMLDESKLYIIPVNSKHQKSIKIVEA